MPESQRSKQIRTDSLAVKIRRTGSEFSDQVIKVNKKADMLLEMKLQILERQEATACKMLKRDQHEVKELQKKIRKTGTNKI